MMTQPSNPSVAVPQEINAPSVTYLRDVCNTIKVELAKVIVGQDAVVDQLLIALLTRSHALLVGVPGLAKTMLVSVLAQTLRLSFKRIQFTPDLMPSDITGSEVIHQDPVTGERVFRFLKGPVFTNVLLADEINRTPPKTQAALLEAMQERKISMGGTDYPLPDPFFVLATQNPIEQEGTYPLPEAQLDRFLFMILVDYPTAEEERQIMKLASSTATEPVEPVLNEQEILHLQQIVRRMPVAEQVYAYAERLVRATRPQTREALESCRKWLTWGAGPRASMNLILAAKARALMRGHVHVSCDDVAAMAAPVLRHRLILNFTAQTARVTPDEIVHRLVAMIPKDVPLE